MKKLNIILSLFILFPIICFAAGISNSNMGVQSGGISTPVDADKFGGMTVGEFTTYMQGEITFDTSNLVEKVSGATNGNFGGLNASGELTDSGSKAADFEPAITTLEITKGGTNNNSYTDNKFVIYNGSALSSSSYDETSFYIKSTTFNATTDWGSASGGYYTITYTHNIGSTSVMVQVWDTTSGQSLVFPDSINIIDTNNINIKVLETPDNRFAGKICVTK
jgi:hypothetical protein